MIRQYQDEIIWIIGASSGIGYALANELSKHGARLILSARRTEELEGLRAQIGSQHLVYPLDVSNSDLVVQIAQSILQECGRIDRVIFMSAIYNPMPLDMLDMVSTKQIIDINLFGAFNIINAILPIFKKQKFAQIALCGSVAGYIGLPGGQPYSATKAAIINIAESLSAEFKHIDVKLISPGFVRTSLTDKNDFPMPFLMKAEDAAIAIANGLISKHFEIHFPKKFTFWLKILELLPYSLKLKITRKIKKPHAGI